VDVRTALFRFASRMFVEPDPQRYSGMTGFCERTLIKSDRLISSCGSVLIDPIAAEGRDGREPAVLERMAPDAWEVVDHDTGIKDGGGT